jgi:hypothetical protein
MRWTFPQDRLVYNYSTGSPLYPVPTGTQLAVFLDQTCAQPADLQDESGTPIGNIIAVGNDTLLPLFLGPDTTDGAEVVRLWARPLGAPEPYQLDALVSERIDNLVNSGGGVIEVNGQQGHVVITAAGLGAEQVSAKGQVNGYAALDSTGKVPDPQANRFIYPQGVAAEVWTIQHNLGRYPTVTVVLPDGSRAWGEVHYPDLNTVQINFTEQLAGTATCI